MYNENDRILVDALKEAGELRNTYLGSEHLLLAILKKEYPITRILNAYGMCYEKVKKDVLRFNYQYGNGSEFKGYSPVVNRIIGKSLDSSEMIMALLLEHECVASCFFEQYKIPIEKIVN